MQQPLQALMSTSNWINNLPIIIISLTKIYYYHYYYFHTSSKWWFFTEIQVTASLLKISIQVNFNSAVVLMISILSLISSFLSLFSRFLGTVPRTQSTIGIIITFTFHIFSVLWQGLFHFFAYFYHCSKVYCDGKIHQMTSSFFLVNQYLVWSSGRDWANLLYLKIPDNFMVLIFFNGFCVYTICYYG